VKIWVSKNSEVPVREQLTTQIALGIAAGDLKIGEKLPSTRELGRRCGLHSNTVGSAYQKLVEQNLLEFRKGSGFYVAESAGERIEGARKLDHLIREFFESAKALGFDETEIMTRIKNRRTSKFSNQFVVVESDPALRQILVYELSTRFPKTIGVSLEELSSGIVPTGAVLAAMADEKPKMDHLLSDGQRCVYLKGRSVSASLSGQTRPSSDETIAVVSGWDGFLAFARIMLLAAKVDPGNLVVRSTADDEWGNALTGASIIICDAVTAASLDGTIGVRPFLIVSDESMTELSLAMNQP